MKNEVKTITCKIYTTDVSTALQKPDEKLNLSTDESKSSLQKKLERIHKSLQKESKDFLRKFKKKKLTVRTKYLCTKVQTIRCLLAENEEINFHELHVY